MPAQDKLREKTILVPTLQYLEASPGGSLDSGALTEKLEGLFQPTGVNANINANNRSAFSQIVRNIVSNRGSGSNMINRGFAAYDPVTGEISITQKGRDLLEYIGST